MRQWCCCPLQHFAPLPSCSLLSFNSKIVHLAFCWNACPTGTCGQLTSADPAADSAAAAVDPASAPAITAAARAGPELDVLEAGVWEGLQQSVHTMQMAPKLPPETDWDTMDPTGRYGVIYIGKDDPLYRTEPGDYAGHLTFTVTDKDYGNNETIERPGEG